jgi:hypothetical protein
MLDGSMRLDKALVNEVQKFMDTTTALTDCSAAPPRIGMRTQGLNLLLTGFVILFLELASIHWFAANLIFLHYVTNIVLLASFLGMS